MCYTHAKLCKTVMTDVCNMFSCATTIEKKWYPGIERQDVKPLYLLWVCILIFDRMTWYKVAVNVTNAVLRNTEMRKVVVSLQKVKPYTPPFSLCTNHSAPARKALSVTIKHQKPKLCNSLVQTELRIPQPLHKGNCITQAV